MEYNRIERKVQFQKFEESFITPQYVSWLNDKELMQFSEQRHTHHSEKSCRNYVSSFANSNNLLYAILDGKTEEHVGNINAYIDYNNLVADIGIIIGKPGLGYGYTAWEKMIRILFNTRKVRKITAGAMGNNQPMIKIFLRANMKYEYSKSKHFIYQNKFVDLVGYSIFKPETSGI